MQLLSHLATFLPPPLTHLVNTEGGTTSAHDVWGLIQRAQVHKGLKFWTGGQANHDGSRAGGRRGDADEGKWWSVEELGDGASVVKSSKGGCGGDKEVWVLRMGETGKLRDPDAIVGH